MEGTHAPKGEFYSLRWTNYLNNLAETVFSHQNLEKLTDVTLFCEGQFIRAHKLILSSCSVFFQELFKPGVGIPDITGLAGNLIHPVIVMNGIKYNHLKHIVDFIYRGEIRVLDSDLEGVLALGESMRIKGLCSVKLRSKSLENENSVELNTQSLRSDSLKVDYKTETPDKILKPDSSCQSMNNQHAKITQTKQLTADTLQSIQLPEPSSSTQSVLTSHNQEEINDNVPRTEKAELNMNTTENEDSLLNTEIPQQNTSQNLSDVQYESFPVEKENSVAHRLKTLSEHHIEPKLKRIKFSSALLDPIRNYENNAANKKIVTKSLTETKQVPPSSSTAPSFKEEEKKDQIPRPPNAFMIFANDWRKKLSVEHPDENNKDISIRLGNLWKSLSMETKDNYYEEAAKISKEYKAKYPESFAATKKNTFAKKIVKMRKSLPASESGEALSEGSLEVINCEESDSNSRDTVHSSKSN